MSLLDVSRWLEARGEFYNRVRGGVITQAALIYAEDSATPNHTERLAWAKDVLYNGNYDARTKEMLRLALMLESVRTNPDVITDEAILQGIASFLPQVIGV